MNASENPDRHHALDGVRGLAALIVALHHCILHFSGLALLRATVADFGVMSVGERVTRLLYLLFPGDAAVVVFFVLSGYVLSRALYARGDAWQHALLPYAVRRIFRLYPVNIAATLPLILLLHPDMRTALSTLLITSNALHGVLWSLQMELVGSVLVFAVWACGQQRAALYCLIALLGASLLAEGVLPDFMPERFLSLRAASTFFLCLAAFMAGMLIPESKSRLWHSKRTLVFAILALTSCSLLLGRTGLTRAIETAAAFCIVACTRHHPHAILKSRFVAFLGKVSYPFYLLHATAILLTLPLFAQPWFATLPIIVKPLFLALLSCPLALLLARLIHLYIEKPGMRSGAWLNQTWLIGGAKKRGG